MRRRLLQAGMAAIGAAVLAGCEEMDSSAPPSARKDDTGPWVMPEEGDPHKRTWMAFGASERIWGRRLLPQVRSDLATIATTIARFEPVSMLVRSEEMDLARELIGASNVELIAARSTTCGSATPARCS